MDVRVTGAAPTRRPMRVLIVDDNQDAADTLALLAGMWGYEARAAYDGPGALAAARSFGPDCLFLDIGLPGMDGYELAYRLRREPALGAAKLVALTAYSGDHHQRRVRDAGFHYHLTKPADPGELERLFRMLAQALKLAERTEALAQQNVELARETRELLIEVKDELKEMKDELREVREELREVKHDQSGLG
ncbi:MAG TPA: response regulator [Gemmataceae bacterium]|nr:response regulator [Gemmataceae bacterium]